MRSLRNLQLRHLRSSQFRCVSDALGGGFNVLWRGKELTSSVSSYLVSYYSTTRNHDHASRRNTDRSYAVTCMKQGNEIWGGSSLQWSWRGRSPAPRCTSCSESLHSLAAFPSSCDSAEDRASKHPLFGMKILARTASKRRVRCEPSQRFPPRTASAPLRLARRNRVRTHAACQ